MMVVAVELLQNLGERRLVIGDELALGFALGAVAERIEGGAAQEFQPHQQTEKRKQPGAEADLARHAGARVAAREERRGEMELEAKLVAVELLGDLAQELPVAVK